jgi:dihydroorotase
MNKLTFRLPDNWHAHLRQEALLDSIFHHFNIYGRVLAMGNTAPMIETPDDALRYRREILEREVLFEPVTCIMLTEDTTAEIIFAAADAGIRHVKFIPIGTSTGAVKGLRLDDFERLFVIFLAIEETGIHLLLHAELMSYLSGQAIPLLEREEKTISIVSVFRRFYPKMKITIEHASTAKMIEFVRHQDSANLRATLTPQHALLTYADVCDKQGRILNPYNYCFPIVKKEPDRRAVVKAMISGDERFFAGTDSAPHWAEAKASASPPPGIFFGANEYPRYLEVFEAADALDKFENFTARFGAEYYGYPLNTGTLTVARGEWQPLLGEQGIRYCLGSRPLGWKIIERDGESIVMDKNF